MVKDNNTRIQVTFSKKQAEWLRKNAKKLGMTTSAFIKFLIDKNMAKFASQLAPEELDKLIKIARTPWIKFDDDDYYEW